MPQVEEAICWEICSATDFHILGRRKNQGICCKFGLDGLASRLIYEYFERHMGFCFRAKVMFKYASYVGNGVFVTVETENGSYK